MHKFLNLLFHIFLLASLTAQKAQHFREIPLFENGKEGYACYRIPAIIAAPNGDLLAFAEGRVNGCSDYGNLDIVMKRSRNNGLTWSTLEVVVDNGEKQAGNPAPVVDFLDKRFPDGRLFLVYNTGNNHEGEVRNGNGLREVWYTTSLDQGKTWTKSVNITLWVHRPQQPKVNPQYNFSEDWRSYAITPGHAIQLQKGKYAGRIFIPANHSVGEPQSKFNEYRAHAFYSDDHGQTWQLSASVDIPSSNESIAVELSDGRVMQNMRHQNGESRNRIVALSSDGGANWDTTYFDPQLISPVCQASLLRFEMENGKRALLFSNPASSKRRENMTVKVSFDEGKSWSISRQIRPGDSAYSDLVIQNDQNIGLLYEHGNNGGIHYAHFNYAWIVGGGNSVKGDP